MENRPIAHRARAAQRGLWRGCVVGQRGARSSPHCRPGLDRTNTVAGWQHCLREVLVTAFKSRGARPARYSPCGVSADRPRSTRCAARTWRGCVVGQREARSSPHCRPGLDRTNTVAGWQHGLREVLVTAFKSRGVHSARYWPRGVSADRPRSTRCAAWTWRGCVVGQRRARSSPHCRPGLDRTNTVAGWQHGLQEVLVTAFNSRGARPARYWPRGVSADRPRSTRCAARTWRGCAVGQCGARSSPRRRPGLNRTNTVAGWQHSLWEVLATTFESRGARPACYSPCRVSADRKRDTHCASRTWRGCVVGQRGARSSPHCRPGLDRTNTVAGWQHCLREVLVTAFKSRGARPARYSPCGVSADRPRSTRCAARTWRGCAVGQRGARSFPRRRPGLNRTNTVTYRQHGL